MSKLQTHRRPIFALLVDRLTEDAARIQVVSGPRQVGKTTVVRQALRALDQPSHYASADDPTLRDAAWLEAQWEEAATCPGSPRGRDPCHRRDPEGHRLGRGGQAALG